MPAGAILEVKPRHLALAPPRDQPSGHPVGVGGLGAGLQALVGRPHRGDRLDAVVLVRERLDAGRAQRLELAATVGENV